jgi:multidrug efflux system outer membrane protein
MTRTESSLRLTLGAIAVAVLGACSTTPPPRPELDLPLPGASAANAPTQAQLEAWWLVFNEPRLTALIEEAFANNLDLKSAVARIDEARANLRAARSQMLPTLDAQFSSSRGQISQLTNPGFGPPWTGTVNNAQLVASYEVDVWGRVRAGRDAASASLRAATLDAQAVRIALAAEVANAYFTLRGFDAELAVTRETLVTRDDSVRLQRRRSEAGESSRFDLAQAEAERASVAANIPPLERAVAQSQSALALLVGRSPREVFTPTIARGAELETVTAPEVPSGLPADLLARRPDVLRAEAVMSTTEARIAEARAQYFPRLLLTASYGSESVELSDLFSGPAVIWSVAAGLVQPIIGLERIGAQVDAAEAFNRQGQIAYVQTVQGAFREVHDALVQHRAARESFVAQVERRDKLAETLRLADLRYKSGYTGQLDVLDAQRGLLSAERDRIIALRNRQSALVDLYKALGGGWSPQSVLAGQGGTPKAN